jgi:NO-binding membrane sensor protein with MHYT domain/CheY-like chemotaxis protein
MRAGIEWPAMAQHYHHWLVLLSLLVAILASYTALNLASRIRLSSGMSANAWLAGGGFAMGLGIWCMHFVGMLALSLPIPIVYDLWITLLSMLIAVAVSTFALHMASREHVTRSRLAAAGIAMGIGICSMHYVGMAAIEIAPPIRYDVAWVGTSFAIAIAASFAALWIAFTEREGGKFWRYRRFFGATAMGLAITGMHYAGMIAAQFPSDALSQGTALVDRGWLAGAVTTIALFVMLGTLLLSIIDARMQASLAQANQSSRAKDEFLAMLGHELRNPLASITNAIHLLDRADPRGPDGRFARDVIARQSAHLNALVEDLLDVGRAISGRMALEMTSLELGQSVRTALASLEASGKTAHRRVQFQGVPVWIHGDRTRIEQVVTNLVANAADFTVEGGLIELVVRQQGGDAVLTVRDEGVGLDAQTAARVFELFFQGKQDLQRSRGGLGVGLTLVQRIVEMHGGAVSAASDGPGKGATFTVRLPAVSALAQAGRPPRAAQAAAERRVVIVEDSEDARLTLQRLLESAGHRVATAHDGPTGLERIAIERPDIALVDIGLPGIDGYEVARRLRAGGSRVRLVALTGYGTAEDKAQARLAGFDAHLTKPADIDRLLEMVEKQK